MDEKLASRSSRKTSGLRWWSIFFIAIVACVLIVGWAVVSQGAHQSVIANKGTNVISSKSTTPQDLYVGYKDTVYRLSGQNGAVVWQHALQQPSKPNRIDGSSMQVRVMNQNLIYVMLENTVFVLNGSDGTELWQYAVRLTPAQLAEPRAYIMNVVFDQQRVYIDLATGDVLGFDMQTGKQLWHEVKFPNGASLSAFDGVLYAKSANSQGHPVIYAIDGTTGRFLWHFQREMWGNSSFDPPTVVDGVLYDAGNPLYALDVHTGKKLWEQRLSDRSSFFNDLHVMNGKLYANTSAAVATTGIATTAKQPPTPPPSFPLYTFDAKTGKSLWQSQPGYQELLMNSDAIVVLSNADKNNSKTLQLLDPQRGVVRWQTTLLTPICGADLLCAPPIVQITDGKLLILDGSNQSRTLREFDLQSGKLLVQHPVSLPLKEGLGESLLSNGRLYVQTGVHEDGTDNAGSSKSFWNYNLYAIDIANGKTAWQYKIGKLLEYQDPISPLVLAS
ncbi:PQQ-binding-like beta-propeller repeat protein [Dictyobacter formicarum]|uniref:Pyrrolo-quinoline quinone repeat domain-containing protein n=1 Tax=Dictyobacter formicarum TaxID=2778368 RepID=A0ABQ3VS01_9CHLR|nr:PQQ-binding-like beta-propeller repeat protein [Dictyobacter formicarum]GHO88685.1 hypothetical protein KSZ_66910 [Dictyobacter formicarum]